ncbi:MAG: TPM domain-containing protein [Phycisphaerae bacterium]|nr:TPM domain-containing protein [Gemmatimonadaceae bacterium]
MHIKRITKHLLLPQWQVNRAFPIDTLAAIDRAIKASEAAHAGEVRFAVEGALDGAPLLKGQSARERAIEVFSQLRIWDTEHNNGVLIYLLLADRDVEIVADRGIHAKVGSREWEQICRKMKTDFKQSNYEDGVVSGIQEVTQHLIKHFPASGAGQNELPDKPVVL